MYDCRFLSLSLCVSPISHLIVTAGALHRGWPPLLCALDSDFDRLCNLFKFRPGDDGQKTPDPLCTAGPPAHLCLASSQPRPSYHCFVPSGRPDSASPWSPRRLRCPLPAAAAVTIQPVAMTDKVDTRTYVEEEDENGQVIDETRTYVSGPAPSSLKEEANVSRTRGAKQRPRRTASSSPTTMHTDSDSTAHPASPLAREPKPARPRDKKSKEKRLSAPPAARPSMKGSKTMPAIQTTSSTRRHPHHEDPSCYGISPNAPAPIAAAAAAHHRTRSYTANPTQHPSAYYPPPRPPPANAKYYPSPPPPMLGTSFPPQAPMFPFPNPSPYPVPYSLPPPPMPQDPREMLMARFEPHRPRSAMARHFPPPPPSTMGYGDDYDDGYRDGGMGMERRASLRRRSSRREEDRMRMPPPPRRPSTSRPMSTNSPFVPPPAPRSNRFSIGSVGSLVYDDESLGDESSYQDASPPGTYEYLPRPARRPSIDSPYEGGSRYLEMAGPRSRRNSYYGASNQPPDHGMEEQLRRARQYQDHVDGPTEPLSLDSLSRINQTPSRGTKSVGSREESGYGLRSQANTRTSVEEDITILVKGTASLNIGNTHLNVKDGTEIRIPTNPGGDRESRGGSDDASTVYEEREPRFEQPVTRERAASRVTSRARRQSMHNQHPFQPQHQFDYGMALHSYHQQQMPMPFAPPSGYSYPTQF